MDGVCRSRILRGFDPEAGFPLVLFVLSSSYGVSGVFRTHERSFTSVKNWGGCSSIQVDSRKQPLRRTQLGCI